MMKSSTVFVVGHRPPYVHLVSTRRHSRDKCSQAFPVFRALLPPCIILNANRRTKNGVGLGTRLANRDIMQMCFVGFSIQIGRSCCGWICSVIYTLPGRSAFSDDKFCHPKSKNASKDKEL